ncbi:hypothetical protein D3C76_1005530 [compost metagenome]
MLAVRPGQVANTHHQVVLGRVGQPLGHQLPHTDHRHDIPPRLRVRIMWREHWRRHQNTAGIRRLHIGEVERRRDSHAARLRGALQGVLTQGLGKQVETQRLAQQFQCLGKQHRVVDRTRG